MVIVKTWSIAFESKQIILQLLHSTTIRKYYSCNGVFYRVGLLSLSPAEPAWPEKAGKASLDCAETQESTTSHDNCAIYLYYLCLQ